jgi:predicted aldo/keto reductase-like oxidoreductase
MKTMAGAFFDKDRKEPINCRAALKWVLGDENITTSIPGITSYDHLNENVSVAKDLTLTDQEKGQLRLGQTRGGLYCNNCGQCVVTCSRSLPIPEMMRAYMYTFGYGEARRAREMIAGMGVDANPCVGCSTCTVSCKKSFAVRERIEDVARLQTVPPEILSGAEFV